MSGEVDPIEFAEKVERLCDFLLTQIPRNGSEEIHILEDIRTEARTFQTQMEKVISFKGLDSFMRGIPIKER